MTPHFPIHLHFHHAYSITGAVCKLHCTYFCTICARVRMREEKLRHFFIEKVDKKTELMSVSQSSIHPFSPPTSDITVPGAYLLSFLQLESPIQKTVAGCCRRRTGDQHLGRQQWLWGTNLYRMSKVLLSGTLWPLHGEGFGRSRQERRGWFSDGKGLKQQTKEQFISQCPRYNWLSAQSNEQSDSAHHTVFSAQPLWLL